MVDLSSDSLLSLPLIVSESIPSPVDPIEIVSPKKILLSYTHYIPQTKAFSSRLYRCDSFWSVHGKSTEGSFYFIGRRNVAAYSLSRGYVLRNHYLQFTLDGTNKSSFVRLSEEQTAIKAKSANKKSNINGYLNKAGKSYSIEKFSGGKLLFDTKFCKDPGNMNASSASVRGRLPNFLCDILLPLLKAKVVDITGHILYDIGALGTFEDIPISLHIHVSKSFFSLTEDILDGGRGLSSQYVLKDNNKEYSYGALIEAANDLLIWLTEGEAAIYTSRQQRQEVRLNDIVPTSIACLML